MCAERFEEQEEEATEMDRKWQKLLDEGNEERRKRAPCSLIKGCDEQ